MANEDKEEGEEEVQQQQQQQEGRNEQDGSATLKQNQHHQHTLGDQTGTGSRDKQSLGQETQDEGVSKQSEQTNQAPSEEEAKTVANQNIEQQALILTEERLLRAAACKRERTITEASFKITNRSQTGRRHLRFMHHTSVDAYGCTQSSSTATSVAAAAASVAHRTVIGSETCCCCSCLDSARPADVQQPIKGASVSCSSTMPGKPQNEEHEDGHEHRRAPGKLCAPLADSGGGSSGQEASSLEESQQQQQQKPVAADNCSLCNYLMSIREIASEHDERKASLKADEGHPRLSRSVQRSRQAGPQVGGGKCKRCAAGSKRDASKGTTRAPPDASKLQAIGDQLLVASSAGMESPNEDGATSATKKQAQPEASSSGTQTQAKLATSTLRVEAPNGGLIATEASQLSCQANQSDEKVAGPAGGTQESQIASSIKQDGPELAYAPGWRATRLSRGQSLDEMARQQRAANKSTARKLAGHPEPDLSGGQPATSDASSSRHTRSPASRSCQPTPTPRSGTPLVGRLIVINTNNVSYTIRGKS